MVEKVVWEYSKGLKQLTWRPRDFAAVASYHCSGLIVDTQAIEETPTALLSACWGPGET